MIVYNGAMINALKKARFMSAAARTYEGVDEVLAGVEGMRDALPAELAHAEPLMANLVEQVKLMKAGIGLILTGGEDGVN